MGIKLRGKVTSEGKRKKKKLLKEKRERRIKAIVFFNKRRDGSWATKSTKMPTTHFP